MSQHFPYGELLPPERMLPYGLNRSGFCVTKEELERIEKAYSRDFAWLTWKCLRIMCYAQRRTGAGMVLLKALPWDWGWWRVRLWDGSEGDPSDLCFVFTNHSVLFPSFDSAIAAATIFSSGQHWEIAPLAWMDQNETCRFVQPRRRVRRRLAASSSEKQRIAPNAPM
jgi:hypothetical protein